MTTCNVVGEAFPSSLPNGGIKECFYYLHWILVSWTQKCTQHLFAVISPQKQLIISIYNIQYQCWCFVLMFLLGWHKNLGNPPDINLWHVKLPLQNHHIGLRPNFNVANFFDCFASIWEAETSTLVTLLVQSTMDNLPLLGSSWTLLCSHLKVTSPMLHSVIWGEVRK